MLPTMLICPRLSPFSLSTDARNPGASFVPAVLPVADGTHDMGHDFFIQHMGYDFFIQLFSRVYQKTNP